MVYPHGQGRSIFRDFVRTSFMDGLLIFVHKTVVLRSVYTERDRRLAAFAKEWSK